MSSLCDLCLKESPSGFCDYECCARCSKVKRLREALKEAGKQRDMYEVGCVVDAALAESEDDQTDREYKEWRQP